MHGRLSRTSPSMMSMGLSPFPFSPPPFPLLFSTANSSGHSNSMVHGPGASSSYGNPMMGNMGNYMPPEHGMLGMVKGLFSFFFSFFSFSFFFFPFFLFLSFLLIFLAGANVMSYASQPKLSSSPVKLPPGMKISLSQQQQQAQLQQQPQQRETNPFPSPVPMAPGLSSSPFPTPGGVPASGKGKGMADKSPFDPSDFPALSNTGQESEKPPQGFFFSFFLLFLSFFLTGC